MSSVILKVVYNCALFFLLLVALIRWVFQGRWKGRGSTYFRERFQSFPSFERKREKLIWIHAASLGEVRSAITFIHLLKQQEPSASIILSTITLAGLAEGKKALPELDAHFLLPLDFSWIIQPFVRKVSPDVVILIEGDLWYQFLSQVKECGGKVFVVSGKLSERSASRYALCPSWGKRLFCLIDHICVQSERFKKRFLQAGVAENKLTVTGNLKWDGMGSLLSVHDVALFRSLLKIQEKDHVIVIGSTHRGEEKELLDVLEPLFERFSHLKILIAPRHLERFDAVFDQLSSCGFLVGRYTKKELLTGHERILLIDTMGILNLCYQIADLALVAGSFSSKIGGHHLLEPVLLGVPVIFGKAVATQLDMKEVIEASETGFCLEVSEIPACITSFLDNPQKLTLYKKRCFDLKESLQGAAAATLNILEAVSKPNF